MKRSKRAHGDNSSPNEITLVENNNSNAGTNQTKEILESFPLELEFQQKHKARINNSVTSLCVWNSSVVSGSYASMRFWKCSSAGLEEAQISLKRTAQKHTSFVSYLNSWGDWLLSASSSEEDTSKIIVWNTAGSRELLFLSQTVTHLGSNVCVFRDTLCCTNSKSEITLWRRNGRCIGTVSKHTEPIIYLLSVKDTLWSIDGKGTTYLWNENGECTKELSIPSVSAACVWNGKCVLATHTEIVVLDQHGNREKAIEKSPDNELISVLHPCNLFLFCGTNNGQLLVFDEKLKLCKKWQGHNAGVLSMCVWNGQLWTGGDDYFIRTWKIPVWQMVRVLFAGWLKNSAENCVWALLPRDVFRYLLQVHLHGIYVSY